jgi:methylated-DNA-[protein]-cysteine S-methyltransferase
MSEHSRRPVYAFPSNLGWMAIIWRGDKLARLTFGHPSAAAGIASLEADEGPDLAPVNDAPHWVAEISGRLQAYAAGNDVSFDNVPLDMTHLSAFQTRVVRACRKIARGRVR